MNIHLKQNEIYDIKYTVEGYDENISPWKYLGNNKFEDIWEGSEFDSDKMIMIMLNDVNEIHKVESFEILDLHDCSPDYRKEFMRSCPNC